MIPIERWCGCASAAAWFFVRVEDGVQQRCQRVLFKTMWIFQNDNLDFLDNMDFSSSKYKKNVDETIKSR